MNVTSHLFLIYLFPAFLIVWYLVGRLKLYKLSLLVLFGASLAFYGWANPTYIPYLLASAAFNYLLSLGISSSPRVRRGLLFVGLGGNIAFLALFKYFNFFINSLNEAFNSEFTTLHLLIPLGISFFTFQQIAFLVDTYRDIKKEYRYSPLEYLAYITYFPIIISGPITLHSELIPQFRNRIAFRFSYEKFGKGLTLLCFGLGMKILLAEPLSKLVAYGYSDNSPSAALSAITIIAYTFQIFFDFAGYSNMARGFSAMLGFDIPINFNSPYKALGIGDFWKRWHMTLTRFLTSYIYFPLGGNRKGKPRQMLNIMIVFLISGLWHGANWTFVVWGGLHGISSVIDKLISKLWVKIPKFIRWLFTFIAINVFWVFFRADSLDQALKMLSSLFSGNYKLSSELWSTVSPVIFSTIALIMPAFEANANLLNIIWTVILLLISMVISTLFNNAENLSNNKVISTSKAIICGLIFSFSILQLSSVSTFIYAGY